jgi:hypothetical protein
LRFINPAVVTPQAYMLIDSLPAKHPRRTLTLIAKMLQNLANKPSYAKEAYMSNLNPFVDGNKARINVFLNTLCEVGDFYDTLEVCFFCFCLPRAANLLMPCLTPDGPVYGIVEEGPSDQYYP